MQIDFKDGSFIAIMPSSEKDKLIFVTCGKKSRTETTMSSSELTIDDVEQIQIFLTNWLNDLSK